jgi:hypothetical protein
MPVSMVLPQDETVYPLTNWLSWIVENLQNILALLCIVFQNVAGSIPDGVMELSLT